MEIVYNKEDIEEHGQIRFYVAKYLSIKIPIFLLKSGNLVWYLE